VSNADPLKRITLLYHFTDRRNLASIREHGGLYPMTKLKKRNIKVPAPGGRTFMFSQYTSNGISRAAGRPDR